MIKLYTDAAVKGNPGPAGVGVLVLNSNEQFQLTFPLKEYLDNHQAEFIALKFGLSWLINNNLTERMTFCYTDSRVVVETIHKKYTKNNRYESYLKDILVLMAEFQIIIIEWIPESKNKGADNLARQALQMALNK